LPLETAQAGKFEQKKTEGANRPKIEKKHAGHEKRYAAFRTRTHQGEHKWAGNPAKNRADCANIQKNYACVAQKNEKAGYVWRA